MFGRKKEEKTGTWIVYNRGSALEFAECSCCGYEDNNSAFVILVDKDRGALPAVSRCPGCGAVIRSWEIATEG